MKLKLVRKTRQVESVHGLCKGDTILVGNRRGKVAFHGYDTNQVVVGMEDGRRELMLLSMPVTVVTSIDKKYSQVRPGEYFFIGLNESTEAFLKVTHNVFAIDVLADGHVGSFRLAPGCPHPDARVHIAAPDYEDELLDLEIPF